MNIMDPMSTPFPSPQAPPPMPSTSLPTHAITLQPSPPSALAAGHQHGIAGPPPQLQPRPPTQPFSIPTLPSHGIGLGVLGSPDPSVFSAHPHAHFQALQPTPGVPILQQPPHHQQAQPAVPTPHNPAQAAPPSHGSYGVHTPLGVLTPNTLAPTNTIAIPQLQQDEDQLTPVVASSSTAEAAEQRPHGQLVNRIVVDPPDLQAWRERLFNVDETIVLTNDQFETYFPHIDNVYSHRSTQKYKRKPFVSHYWDCRMKGRPPGTPKSSDPTKKKRKRNARERDLCDVKIKITEYFPGATIQLDDGSVINSAQPTAYPSPQHFGGDGLSAQPTPTGEKFWTIQRVNGNGGNGKGDGVAGPHKHTLAKSDEIKKSTVQRYLQAQEREAKKSQKPFQRKASGLALATAKAHAKDHNLKLYAACFDPFSQRVWIALEVKGMQYQYCETDPFKRPTQLLEANPRGLVPAIREGDWASGESAVILEYLEDQNQRVPLFPTNPRLKANCRLWIDHINSKIVPSYFALIRAVDIPKQQKCIKRLQEDITALVQAADERGPYFLGNDLCLVDIHFAPFVLRLSRMLSELRNWSDPMPGTRWHQWATALEHNPHIQATTSNTELYLETFDLFLERAQPHGNLSS